MVNNLYNYRLMYDVSQEQVAREIDISLSQYRNIEKGRSIPSIYIALKLKEFFRLDNVEKLFQL